MAVPNKVLELVERFRENESVYRSPDYKEAHIRQDFIDPFFAELGWDLRNEQNASEVYKEVIFEDAIKVGGSTKAPDYCFRVGGNRKFFVEAKKPSVNLADSISAAFQVRRYGWSAKLPVSILTDFEEFAVYDCRVMPNKQDKSTTARSLYLPYTDYADRWNEIYDLFSKEAVLAGSLELFADGHKQRKGTTTVDAAFLKEIETWRERLAIALSSGNPDLSSRELNFAVQMTINRLIFLRICEDRGIEPYEQLRSLTEKGEVYQQLCGLFRQADDRYNSGLFHFKPEKGRLDADEFTLTLTLADAPLQQIIQNFYYPDSPYEFSVIPIEILGQVYEQFLGKVIRLTSAQEAVIEDKPEVRKAGGVYYTPTYIVDYIVENTIGRSLAGKTPKQAEKIRVLDPACGSGSFLIGAYQFLLNWYVQQYSENPTKYKKQLYQGGGGDWRLTSTEKKRILLNHIHGVDIDLQAVETTKLSLLLKVLEGESQETLFKQLSLLQERALPDLEQNIKCGNSLIGSDYYDNVQINLLNEEELYRINVFDWEEGFPEIMQSGGFDVVIGNPPYIHSRSQFDDEFKKYIFSLYETAEYQINTFGIFIERSMKVLASKGLLGFIIPNYWLSTKYDFLLRSLLFKENRTINLVNVFQVFKDAVVDCLLVLSEKSQKYDQIKLLALPQTHQNIEARLFSLVQKQFSNEKIVYLSNLPQDLKISFQQEINLRSEIVLGDICNIFFGMKPYQIGKGNPRQTAEIVAEKAFNSSIKVNDLYHKLVGARHIKRYESIDSNEWIKYGEHLAEPRNIALFQNDRLLLQRIISSETIRISHVAETLICNTDVMTIKIKKDITVFCDLKFLMGILASRLICWRLKSENINLNRNAFPKVNTNDLSRVPIPFLLTQPFNNRHKSWHDRIVQLVEQMLALHQQLAEAKTPPQKSMIQKQINVSDRQIDQLVYELYELTAEEIAIVEGK